VTRKNAIFRGFSRQGLVDEDLRTKGKATSRLQTKHIFLTQTKKNGFLKVHFNY